MERKSLGFLAIFLAFAALFGQGGSSGAAAQTDASKPVEPPAEKSGGCKEVPDEGPWQAAAEDFAPNGCKPHGNVFSCLQNSDRKPRFLLATLPDPETTHLALYFDRNLEGMTWAILDDNYSLEHYWLPWKTVPDKDLPTLADRDCRTKQIEARRKQPGLLIFHGMNKPDLWVWLVGETPTSGVNKEELKAAFDFTRANSSTPGSLDLLGPNFSGSLGPLAGDLKRWFADSMPRLHAVSGMVTNAEATREFVQSLPKDSLIYESAIENDDRVNDLFFRYARERWKRGQGPRRVAILAEEETAYWHGVQVPGSVVETHDWITFRYPREISRLRNAYQEETNVAAADQKTVISLTPGVRFTLKDESPDSGLLPDKDNIGAFSQRQSPASQQAVLSSVAASMRQEEIDIAGIVATDVLDSLFLARFLRTATPEVRLYTLDSDLMYLRQENSASLEGMLTVTNYPLISINQHWTGLHGADGAQQRVPFSSSYAEAIYNACRRLVHDPNKPEGLIEYRRPGRDPSTQPALWLTVAGRGRYWPLALLDDYPAQAQTSPTLFQASLPATNEGTRNPFHPEQPGLGWTICFWLLLLFAFVHCVYVRHLLSVSAAHQGSNRGRAIWVPLQDLFAGHAPQKYADRWEEIKETLFRGMKRVFSAYPHAEDMCSPDRGPSLKTFLLTATVAIASSVWILGSPLHIFVWEDHTDLWALIYGLFADVVFAFLVYTVCRLHVSKSAYAVLSVAGWALGLLTCGTWLVMLTATRYKSGYFFAYRTLDLTSGVAPEVPFLLAGAAFFYWSLVQLRREDAITFWEPVKAARPKLQGAIYMDNTDETIRHLFAPRIWVSALPVVLLWVFLLTPWRNLRSLEYWPFGWLYVMVIGTIYWSLAVVIIHFLSCWRSFRGFLWWLETQPFRRAFSRLDKQFSRLPLVNKTDPVPLALTRRAVYCLKAIENREVVGKPQTAGRAQTVSAQDGAAAVSQTETGRITTLIQEVENRLDWQRYGELQRLLDEKAIHFWEDLELSAWRQGNSESLRHELERVTEKTAPDDQESLVILKEEFIALRYLIYIRYFIPHLWNLLLYLVWGFILSVVSLESYSFQGNRWIVIISALTFVTLGVSIGLVLAQMDKDPTLSRLTKTEPYEVGKEFYLRLAQYGVLPLLTLLASQFPSINRFLFSWLQPALETIR